MRTDRRGTEAPVPLPPYRPVDPLELQDLAVARTEDRAGLDHARERLFEREPRRVDLVRQRIHGLAAERQRLEPRCKWKARLFLLGKRRG